MSGRFSSRLLLRLFVASILVNAMLGVWALLAGDFGETQGKVLLTSFLVSAAMLSVLVNLPAARRRVLWPAPVGGAASAVAGFGMLIVLAWAEADSDTWFKLAGSFLVVAAALTLSSSLSLLAAPPRMRWLLLTAHALITLLAVTILVGLWAEPDSDWYARLLGVEAVLVAAVVLILPVLIRFSGSREAPTSVPPAAAAVRYCPSCGEPVEVRPPGFATPVVCSVCGLSFEVTTAARPARSADDGRTATGPSSA